MSRAARVGLIALVAVLLAGAGIYLAVKARGTGGYRMGVRFRSAAGIAPGAQVYFNGVNIGTVRKVKILPDTTVDFILDIFHATDIPKDAEFSIQTRFTGTSSINIDVPRHVAANQVPRPVPSSDLLPKRIVPVDQQPVGSTPLTIEDVMGQGKALGDRAYRVLALARPYGSRLLGRLQDTRANGAATSAEMHTALPAILANLRATAVKAKANLADAQSILQHRDQSKLAAISAAFSRSAGDMNSVSASMTALKNDPNARANLRDAAQSLRATSATMAQVSGDMASLAKNTQTKAQLRDAGLRFRSVMERLKSLLP